MFLVFVFAVSFSRLCPQTKLIIFLAGFGIYIKLRANIGQKMKEAHNFHDLLLLLALLLFLFLSFVSLF